jgi:hypothetical protein
MRFAKFVALFPACFWRRQIISATDMGPFWDGEMGWSSFSALLKCGNAFFDLGIHLQKIPA